MRGQLFFTEEQREMRENPRKPPVTFREQCKTIHGVASSRPMKEREREEEREKFAVLPRGKSAENVVRTCQIMRDHLASGNPLFSDVKAPFPHPWKLFGARVFLILATCASGFRRVGIAKNGIRGWTSRPFKGGLVVKAVR